MSFLHPLLEQPHPQNKAASSELQLIICLIGWAYSTAFQDQGPWGMELSVFLRTNKPLFKMGAASSAGPHVAFYI